MQVADRLNKFFDCVGMGALILGMLVVVGCEQPSEQTAIRKNFLDPSVDKTHNLGWLGARSHPLKNTLKFLDPDSPENGLSISPGGIVLTELDEGAPLAKMGLRSGDVVVRIGEDWMPIKEDPTLDVIAGIENLVSAKRENVVIGYVRDGSYATAELPIEKDSIDEGLPLPSQRLTDISTRCLRWLSNIQLKDGSFDTESSRVTNRLRVTSACGLAFLSADKTVMDEFDSNVEACIEFVSNHLNFDDRHSVEKNLDPLTAAYVAIFLAESRIQVLDEDWLDKIGGLLDFLSEQQQPSGAWTVSSGIATNDPLDLVEVEDRSSADAVEEKPKVDVAGTFTTNQVLLALGAWERKGMSVDNKSIEQACLFLAEQAKLRIPSPIDRRIKAVLSAGTAAALVALNCSVNDVALNSYLKDGMMRAHDMFTSPSLGLPGLLHTAIVARQFGNEPWLNFHNAVKHLVIMLPNVDGRVVDYPNITRDPLAFEIGSHEEAWLTAHVATIASMQSQQLEKVLGITKPPTMFARDSNGAKIDENSISAKIPNSGPNSDAEALKKMIMEQLKAQGMDVDESKLKIQSSPPK